MCPIYALTTRPRRWLDRVPPESPIYICPGCLSTAWLVSHIVLSCRMAAKVHSSFRFGLCCRKFVMACLVSGQDSPRTILCHTYSSTQELYRPTPFSSGSCKVAFEEIPVFGLRRSECLDYSLYLYTLVLLLEAIVLSQVYVAFDMFYLHIAHVVWDAVYTTSHLSLRCSSYISVAIRMAFL